VGNIQTHALYILLLALITSNSGTSTFAVLYAATEISLR